VRRQALAMGEEQLALGCVSHNYFHFYQMAIDVAFELGEPAEVLRYAAALERYTAREPLPWTDFVIARGRALARYMANERDARLGSDLRSLHESAVRLDRKTALPHLETALASL